MGSYVEQPYGRGICANGQRGYLRWKPGRLGLLEQNSAKTTILQRQGIKCHVKTLKMRRTSSHRLTLRSTRTAQQLRCWVPSALRAPAAG